jgi:hypothetical protein
MDKKVFLCQRNYCHLVIDLAWLSSLKSYTVSLLRNVSLFSELDMDELTF